MENNYYPFENTPLPYADDALEPAIDKETIGFHYGKHLQTYVNNLNNALKDYPELQKLSLEELIANPDALPEKVRNAVRNNGGGVYNHRFYFEGLTNTEAKKPSGKLYDEVVKCFGSLDAFKAKFKEVALGVFGSGYAWLVVNNGKLEIIGTPNQNSPLALGLKPIMTIDVWEHAYYLKYKNVRAAYIDSLLDILNWEVAEKRFLEA